MDNSIKGLKYILSYMKKYWLILIFVTIFIVLSTWLQVQSPKIMGEAINEMTEYVGLNIAHDGQNELYDSLAKGKGLSEEQKELISNSSFDQDVKDKMLKASNEELEMYAKTLMFKSDIYDLDAKRISNGDGLSEKQKTAVKENKDVIDPIKMQFLAMSNEDLKTDYESIQDGKVTVSEIDESHGSFIKTLWLLVLSYICLALGNLVYNILMAIVSAKSTKDMRYDLFGKLKNLSIRFFDQSNDGDLLSRFTNDIDNISNAMNQTLVQIVSQFAMLIGVIIMMFKEDTSTGVLFGMEINNLLTWQMIAFAVFAIILATFVVSKAQYHVSKQQSKLGTLNGYIDERISAQAIIITNDLEKETVAGFETLNNDYCQTSIKGQIYSGILMPMMSGIGLINLGTLTFVGASYVATGDMSVGLLVAFIQYSQRFFQPLGQIFSQYNILELAVTGAARIKEIMIEDEEIKSNADAIEIDGINGEVSLEHVSFGYNPQQLVLKDINISVKKGQKVALVGPTGSGKTTVMNLMNRFYDVNEGAINIDGINIQDMTLSSLRKNVGIVLQESVLFSGTIFDNIAYGKDNASEEEVKNAAKLANIHDFIMELDEGYMTHVNNNTSVFSTGQKQLMSIARTILTNPDLLILDEATSNVDTVTEAKIQGAMENVLNGRTSFVIAHRLKTILDSDKIVVLKDGEIIECGTHQELLTEDGFYAELYKNQFVIE